MAFKHGKDFVFSLDNSSGVLTDITSYLTRVGGLPGEAEVAETTTASDSAKEYLAGLADARITLEGRFDPTVDAILQAALGASATRSFEYGPQGSTSGNVKYSGECLCTRYEVETGLDGVGAFTAELQVSGAVTRGTYA